MSLTNSQQLKTAIVFDTFPRLPNCNCLQLDFGSTLSTSLMTVPDDWFLWRLRQTVELHSTLPWIDFVSCSYIIALCYIEETIIWMCFIFDCVQLLLLCELWLICRSPCTDIVCIEDLIATVYRGSYWELYWESCWESCWELYWELWWELCWDCSTEIFNWVLNNKGLFVFSHLLVFYFNCNWHHYYTPIAIHTISDISLHKIHLIVIYKVPYLQY